jgi:hypothetical protein
MTRRKLNRIGCGVLVFLWFAFLIIGPCAVITLLTNEDGIVVTKSNTPDDRVRIWLLPGAQSRGIGVENGYITRQSESQVCTASEFNFLIWGGEPVSSRKNCLCYEKKGIQFGTISPDATCGK